MRLKRVTCLVWTLITVTLLAGCASRPSDSAAKAIAPQPAQGKRVIRIAHQNDGLIVLAKAKGFFEEEFSKDGTTVVYNRYVAGPPIMEAFSAGREDVGIAGDMPPVSARATGVDVRAVAVASRDRIGYTLTVLNDSPIKSVQDLKGKKLAAQVGSAQYHYALLLLDQKGFKRTDVNLVNLPLTELRTALEAKSVDAVVANPTLSATLEYEKVGRIVPDSLGIKQGLLFFVIRGEFGEKNPDLVERWLEVLLKTRKYEEEHLAESLEILAKETKYPTCRGLG